MATQKLSPNIFRSFNIFNSKLILLENQHPRHKATILTILSFAQIQQWLMISLQNKWFPIKEGLKLLYGPNYLVANRDFLIVAVVPAAACIFQEF